MALNPGCIFQSQRELLKRTPAQPAPETNSIRITGVHLIISILNFPRWLQCSSKFEKPWAGAEAGAGAQVPQGQCAWEYVWGAGRQGAGDQMSRDKPGNIQAGDVGGTRAVVNGRARERSAIWGNKSWYEFRTWYGLSKKMRTEWVWQDSY